MVAEESKELVLLQQIIDRQNTHHNSFEEMKKLWLSDRVENSDSRRKLGFLYEGWTQFLGFAQNLSALPDIRNSLNFVQDKLIDAATGEKKGATSIIKFTIIGIGFVNLLLMIALLVLLLRDSNKEFRTKWGELTNGRTEKNEQHEQRERLNPYMPSEDSNK